MQDPLLRAARDTDSAGVIALIGAVFAEYPGCVLDVDLEEPELRAPASSFEAFWVLEARAAEGGPGVVVGCVGLGLHGPGDGEERAAGRGAGRQVAELKKLYLARAHRGRGLGARLVRVVEDEARRRAAGEIELWTDTRFTTAHAVYARLGYQRTGRQRALNDLSATIEDHYVKSLSPAPLVE